MSRMKSNGTFKKKIIIIYFCIIKLFKILNWQAVNLQHNNQYTQININMYYSYIDFRFQNMKDSRLNTSIKSISVSIVK